MKNQLRLCLIVVSLLVFASCNNETKSTNDQVHINYEEYTLPNGLKVVLHEDHSDPIVAQAIAFHVGSAREKEGKTGFAHFFEHMLFQRSENLPRNAFFNKISDMGGTFNGGTSNDFTVYFECVPRNALEKIMWMESDRMGYFINTVTQSGLEREIDVICNEKRQTEVNNAYGMMDGIMCKEFFPNRHPYSWTVIGEFEDVKSATIEDVKEFYGTYYVPSNATLCIAGDFDTKEVKALIEKYFAEIPSHPVEKPAVWDVTLNETKAVYYEDQFANMPAVEVAYPAVASGHNDEAALDVFCNLFGRGKNSPLYKNVVEAKLAPAAQVYNNARESAGMIDIMINAFPGVDADAIMAAIAKAKADFEANGVNEEELATVKADNETSAYRRLGSVLGKAQMLAQNKEFFGKPDKFVDDIASINAVTAEDVMRVYNKYVKDANYVAVVAVPKGQAELAIEGSRLADIVMEDQSKQTMRSAAGAVVDDDYERTPSKIDRSVEPDYMPNTPKTSLPQIWRSTLANGVQVAGISQHEIPMVNLSVMIKGGASLDPAGKRGTAAINASMMNEGTALHSAVEVEQSLKKLGASARVDSDKEYTTITISSLSKNLPAVMDIVTEMVTLPKFDEEAFGRAVQSQKSTIARAKSSITSIGSRTAAKLWMGDCLYSDNATDESIDAITMDDVKAYYKTLTPKNASVEVAGDVDQKTLMKALASLEKWQGGDVTIPEIKLGKSADAGLYFVDFPGSKQSYIFIIGPGMDYNNPDYHKLDVLNRKLGAGSSGRLFEVLRLQRGYTYGASSAYRPYKDYGYFQAASSVQGSSTKESVALFKEIFSTFAPAYTQDMLDGVKASMLRANASAFETTQSLVNMLRTIRMDNLSDDFIAKEEAVVDATSLDDIKALAKDYLDVNKMIFVVVGDAATQLKNLPEAKLIAAE
ncbi:MAG: insulinase family protein [Bacteroidaceae bacterium]|nr:insulinase family protein [Bacteroidaceae bacterium]